METLNNFNAAGQILKEDKILLCCTAFFIVSTYGILKPFSIAFLSNLKDLSLFSAISALSLLAHIPLLFFRAKALQALGVYKTVFLSTFFYGFISSALFALAFFFTKNEFVFWSKFFIILFSTILEFFNIFVLGIFWFFVHSFSTEDIAKKLYPMLILAGQIGCLVATFIYSIFNVAAFSLLPCIITFVLFLLSSYLFTFSSRELRVNRLKDEQTLTPSFRDSFWLLFSDNYYRFLLLFGIICETLTTVFELIFIAEVMHLDCSSSSQIFFIYTFIYSAQGFIFGFFNIDRDKDIQLKLLKTVVFLCFLFAALFNSLFILLLCSATIKSLMHTTAYNIKLLFWVPTSIDAKFNTKAFYDLFCKLSSKVIGFMLAFIGTQKLKSINLDIYFLILFMLLISMLLVMKFLVKAKI